MVTPNPTGRRGIVSVLPHPFVQPAGEGKVCNGCKKFVPYDDFSWNSVRHKSNGKRYRSSQCKRCKSDAMKAWNKRVGQRRARSTVMKKAYGIDHMEYAAMVAAQNNACAICGRIEQAIDKRTGKRFDLAIDHCHTTGKVRSLLCYTCNNGLGCFKDDPNLLRAAAEYLTRHQAG